MRELDRSSESKQGEEIDVDQVVAEVRRGSDDWKRRKWVDCGIHLRDLEVLLRSVSSIKDCSSNLQILLTLTPTRTSDVDAAVAAVVDSAAAAAEIVAD